MALIQFAITYCCQELHLAMIKREYWFEMDTNTKTTILVDNDNKWSGTCPFCHRNIEDVVDIEVKID
jgi:hypothetical protein